MPKRIFLVLVLVMMAALASGPLYAKDMKTMAMMEDGKEKGVMGGKMMGMHMMMKKMMEKSVVATSDGGVVIVAGDKITKYDKDLKFVNEAELQTGMAAMHEPMKEMMENCPRMKGEDTAEGKPAAASGHEGHH